MGDHLFEAPVLTRLLDLPAETASRCRRRFAARQFDYSSRGD
jgi:hypothetical protein